MTDQEQRDCPGQRMKVPASWCEDNQYDDRCRGCQWNKGLKRSKHQEKSDKK